ncbi:SGNH hydrolase domain-containing protein [Nocardioides litoris]|uniref:SGNH hydrolase domain-containing protein n=1 Tax=Nocardioides litoris TaxID=1926648 RepID=UPI00111DD453|nr:SGNH hydrolase domain-containing protein [Nocardioides litoris]
MATLPPRLVALALALVVALGLLTGPGAPTAAADVRPGPALRGDVPGVDAPVMPKGCFGPARSGIEPFPCPLVAHRPGRPTVLLWGDSHAYMYIPALVRAVRGRGVNLVSFVAGSCPPVLVTDGRYRGPGAACRRSNYKALRYVASMQRAGRPLRVVIGSNWSGFRRAYRRLFLEGAAGMPSGYDGFTKDMVRLAHQGTPALFDRLAQMRVDVDIIGQAATVPDARPACAAGETPYACDLPRWRAIPEERRTARYLREQQVKIQRHARSRVIDTTPGYCTASTCRGRVGSVATWFDDLHLSATRTRNLASYFAASVRDARRRR